MNGALYTGVTGMMAHELRLDAVGNNIANADTVGYKGQRVMFTDALAQLLEAATPPSDTTGGTNPSEVGTGVYASAIDTNFGQGNLQATGRTTDVAVDGDGFLIVTDGSRMLYTRNGGLGLDAAGNLVQLATGYKVVATPATSGAPGTVAVSPTSTLQLPIGHPGAARATSTMRFGGNLDSRSTASQPAQVTARVFDSLGAAHNLTLGFTPSATAGTWNVSGTSPDGTVSFAGSSAITFDANGRATTPSLPMTFTLTSPGSATGTMAVNLDVSSLSQLAQESGAALVEQDGMAPGTLTGISFGTDGAVIGSYTNGLTSVLGQVVTATFENPAGLRTVGGSLYQTDVNSGEPVYGIPGAAGRGLLRGGQLEASNVNLAQEFADMIVTQRGFQASSRVVTAADQMLQDLLNTAR